MPTAEAHTSSAGRGESFSSAATSRRVPSIRLSRISRLACSVQRCATGSPARCTMASAGGSAVNPRIFSGCTAWPSAINFSVTLRPMNPLAPVTMTFMRTPPQGHFHYRSSRESAYLPGRGAMSADTGCAAAPASGFGRRRSAK